MTFHHRICRLAPVAILGALISSCASTGGSSPSGFLSDFGQLGGGYATAGAVAAYMSPKADFRDYDTIVFEPVTTIIDGDKVDPRAAEQLAAYLASSLKSELGEDLRIVGVPGPRTLRVRVALTDIVEGTAPTSPVTTVQVDPKTPLKGAVGSNAPFIASVSFEGEVLDSLSGERLSAVSDQRLGAKRGVNPSTDWVAVRSLVEQGAENLAGRLRQVQAR